MLMIICHGDEDEHEDKLPGADLATIKRVPGEMCCSVYMRARRDLVIRR